MGHGANGRHVWVGQVTTKETTLPPPPYLTYGQVETAQGLDAAGAVVRGWLVDGQGAESAPLSTVVDGFGYWSLNLPTSNCAAYDLKLEAFGVAGGEAALTVPACDARPATVMVLSGPTTQKVYLPLILRHAVLTRR